MVHIVKDPFEEPVRVSHWPDRGSDQGAEGAWPVGGVLDAAVKLVQRGLGGHRRDRHHGGKPSDYIQKDKQ